MDLSPLYVWNDIVVALLYTSQKKKLTFGTCCVSGSRHRNIGSLS